MEELFILGSLALVIAANARAQNRRAGAGLGTVASSTGRGRLRYTHRNVRPRLICLRTFTKWITRTPTRTPSVHWWHSSNCRGLLRVLTRVNLNPADFENLLILFIYHLV